jgi:hypothetical protein
MRKRTKIIIGIIGVVVIAGTAATIVFWPAVSGFVTGLFQQKTADNLEPVGTPEPVIKTDNQLYDKALSATAEGGPEAGQAVLDERLTQATDNKEKAAIYSQKATLAASPSGGGDTSKALEYAYLTEEQDPTYASAIYIADLEYYENDNKVNALKYYKLYLERLTDQAIDLNPGDKAYYEQLVQEIEASL